MPKCIVEMFGLPYGTTDLREVEIELSDGATLGDVIATLKSRIPALVGPVIRNGENRLTDFYKISLNGHFYFDDFSKVMLNNADRITLLTVVEGG